MNKKPSIIGFTLDHEEAGGYSKMPYYAIRENYLNSISSEGAIPLPLSYEINYVNQYINMIDGLVITGGAFDVSPELYGDESVHETVILKKKRTEFENALTRGMIATNKPILGICGGEQLLNVILGGRLIQHIPDSFANCLEHEQPNPRSEAGHTISIKTGTLLHKIIGKNEISVNSAHHQAVLNVGENVLVNAVAPDGVIEGIEYTKHKFCLGVQWHPEYHVTEYDQKIFEAFVAVCV